MDVPNKNDIDLLKKKNVCVCAGEEALRLIFTDKMLDGDNTLLSEYGIQHMSVLHMVMKVPGGLTA